MVNDSPEQNQKDSLSSIVVLLYSRATGTWKALGVPVKVPRRLSVREAPSMEAGRVM